MQVERKEINTKKGYQTILSFKFSSDIEYDDFIDGIYELIDEKEANDEDVVIIGTLESLIDALDNNYDLHWNSTKLWSNQIDLYADVLTDEICDGLKEIVEEILNDIKK